MPNCKPLTTVQPIPLLNCLFGVGVGEREAKFMAKMIEYIQLTYSQSTVRHTTMYVLRASRTGMGLCVLTTTPALCKLILDIVMHGHMRTCAYVQS